MNYKYSWGAIFGLIWLFSPHPYLTLIVICSIHLLLWTLLCGGVSAMYEIIEARTQPELPLIPPHPARRPTVVVIGSAVGLGKEVVRLLHKKKYSIMEGDVLFDGVRHCNLASVGSVKAFADRIRYPVIDVLVLVAGVCDATGVPVSGSKHPRMLWVNYLGYVCLLSELETIGIIVKKIVVVSSGSYARGSTAKFFPSNWGVTEAVQCYSQSKFLLTTHFARLQQLGLNVILINPGPMRTTIGDRHVPIFLWPIFGLMKEILFPMPSRAAKSVIHCVDTKLKFDYMHIRVRAQLDPIVLSSGTQQWVLSETCKALPFLKVA